jgi:cell division protein FtsI/penicillin-binding protein 2
VNQVASGDTVQLHSPRFGLLLIEPTIADSLQASAEAWLRQIKSPRAAIVLTEAATGRVLVLAGVRAGQMDHRVALEADAPAASLFKIVTAAAAVEDAHLDPSSPLYFTGRPHSLFKGQISPSNPRKASQATLRQSFAISNNPVFGKLGVYHLGGELLTWYGKALGFESRLPFELPLGVSQLTDPGDDYALAGMASGYNNETTISPVHAALLAGLFVNQGRLMEPYIVHRVLGPGREPLYLGRPRSLGRIVSEQTCQAMLRMFEATITEGTARKAFNQLGKDPVLRNVTLGGKTGTFSGPDHAELFEWFAGFGRDDNTGRALAIAVVVAHHRTRWANSKNLARLMLRQAFSHPAKSTHLVSSASQEPAM